MKNIIAEMQQRIENNYKIKKELEAQDKQNADKLAAYQQTMAEELAGGNFAAALVAKAEYDKASEEIGKQLKKRPEIVDNITELWDEYRAGYAVEFEKKLEQYEKTRADLFSQYEDLLILQGAMLNIWNTYKYGMKLFAEEDLLIDAPLLDGSSSSFTQVRRAAEAPADLLLYMAEARRRGEHRRELYANYCVTGLQPVTAEEVRGSVTDEEYFSDLSMRH